MEWYELSDSEHVQSPSLLVFPERIKYNAKLMTEMAKSTDRLRPHIKTHKMAEIIKIQLDLGITKYKCATLKEAEVLAKSGAKDILLAMQPVSYQLKKYVEMILNYPGITFSTIVDNSSTARELHNAAIESELILNVWLDLNNGMDRTGIQPGKDAEELFIHLCDDPYLLIQGFHVYDGHIHQEDPILRAQQCDQDYEAITKLKNRLEDKGFLVPEIIAGGTPTFPIHQKRTGVQLSPGTPLLWDAGYGSNFKDLKFLLAAVLFTRIVSKPNNHLLCLDLGHKSVASEMNLPRVAFLGNHEFQQISQSEEHLVVKCLNSDSYEIGQGFYAVPIHICPTVAKYPEALTVQGNKVIGSWQIAARDHNIN